jgi:putative transcriptional regulator
LDLAFATLIFDGPVLEKIDDRADYGETRIQAIGAAEGEILFVVYTYRGTARRIISVRLAKAKEAIVRKSLEEIKAGKPNVDHEALARVTEDDIRRHQIEDGEDPDASLEGFTWNIPAKLVREKLRMTQEEMAHMLRIPVATLRNWEQDRVRPDPAARALLTLLFSLPDQAKKVLAAAE